MCETLEMMNEQHNSDSSTPALSVQLKCVGFFLVCFGYDYYRVHILHAYTV